MAQSPIMNVMRGAVEKAGRALRRDFGEIENLQVSKALAILSPMPI